MGYIPQCIYLYIISKGVFNLRKVYISGPMTGLPKLNTPAFNDAEKKLKKSGYAPFNPAHLMSIFDPKVWTPKEMLVIDIALMSHCDSIYMLPGWENSKGAQTEYQYAKSVGMSELVQDETCDDVFFERELI